MQHGTLCQQFGLSRLLKQNSMKMNTKLLNIFQVGLAFQTRLLNVNLIAVDKSTQKEVEMFLIAIQKNPPIMNLDQYADINRGLITSVISSHTNICWNHL